MTSEKLIDGDPNDPGDDIPDGPPPTLLEQMGGLSGLVSSTLPILAGSSLPVALPGPLAAQVQKEMERRQKAAQEAAQAADNDTKE